MNPLMRRVFQLTVALALCAPALLADTFQLPGGANPYGASPVFSRPNSVTIHGASGIQALVNEFQTTSHQNQPPYAAEIKESGRTIRGANRVVKFDQGGRQDRRIDYMTVAVLAIQMIGIDRSTAFGRSQTGVVNNALWGVFYPAFNKYGFAPRNDGPRQMAQAQTGRGQTGVPNIWRPSPKDPPREPKPPVRVPEPSLGSLLAFNALVLTILGLCLRRRGIRFVE